MDVPESTSSSYMSMSGSNLELSGTGGLGFPGIASGTFTAKENSGVNDSRTRQEARQRGGLQQVVREIGGSSFVVLLDDFHYIDREIQVQVAKQLKEAIRLGVRLVVAAVTHRGDDVVRANPELRGRLQTIDVPYWDINELKAIASKGFRLMNLSVEAEAISRLANEAAGSPQLMQSQCLNTCFVGNYLETFEGSEPAAVPFSNDFESWVMRQTSGSTDFRSLVDVLQNGPQTRGTERKTYKLIEGKESDVYGVVLRALAADPPNLSFDYDDLMARVARVCSDSTPVGSSVNSTCIQIDKLAKERFPLDRSIEWDDQKSVLNIPDPYLLFYLRWSGRVRS